MEPILVKHNEYIEQVERWMTKEEGRLYEEWLNSIKMNAADESIDEMDNARHLMFSQMIDTINGKLSETAVREMAKKVATERMNRINIGDVLYNINQGRRVITNFILTLDIPVDNLQLVINDVNRQFDIFSHELVSTYSHLANKVIDEKNTFINENHKDKLALLGQISSSFVHEFRNPLTAVMGFNKILKKEYPDMKYLDIMDYELNQLNFRITQFLHTSKAEFNEDLIVDISIRQLIEEIKQLSYASIVDTNVKVNIDVADDLMIKASRNGLKQVILNVFVNSIDALKNVAYERIINVKAFIRNHQIIISLSNNGPMIEKENIESIFEPFYTTKELGTGIGLYVCRKIIESYDGYLVCTSLPEWTTFYIHLPDSIIIAPN
ncbi:histidine kinase [Pradoshia eiseniae]|uniref:histidine kinase n=1 Tax=Pradoshia eiseniae TaxID=2064768 RepID=A0A2S7N5H7_9BACI|nr:HAMP domain-containing sensor histidine kinase [Pradoshia eiseniae]PQD97200.1 histidine kinase [Pradoshia eiseniae]